MTKSRPLHQSEATLQHSRSLTLAGLGIKGGQIHAATHTSSTENPNSEAVINYDPLVFNRQTDRQSLQQMINTPVCTQ